MKIQQKLLMCFAALFMFIGSLFFGFEDNSTAYASSYNNLQPSIDAILKDGRMSNGTNYSVTVRKASTGEMVYSKNGDHQVTPASSLKILTAASALETLGENHRFTTEVLTNGQVAKGTLYGNLYLRGKGDPTLLKSDLDHFASILANRGVKRVSGHIIGDDSHFDAVRLSPGISKKDESYYYAARVSALTLSPNSDYDAGSVIVKAKPAVTGRASAITLTPATDAVRVINRSKTVPKGNKNTLKIQREYGTNRVIITGNIPAGSGEIKEWIAVPDPTAYALDVFKKSLAAKGITFVPTSKVMRGTTPEQARVLLSKKSMPLKDLIVPFMKLSNNSHAEILAKEMGKAKFGEGSWNAGLRVMREYAESVGLDPAQWSFEDASGMSHANKVSSSQMTLLLSQIRTEPWFGTFMKGLPIAGESDRFVGGTLRKRLTAYPAKGNVRAKTGSLDGVSSLSGYVTSRDGELLIFSILTSDAKTSTVPVLDRIADAVAKSNHN